MTPFLTVDYSGGMLLEDKLILSGRVDDADNNRWNYSVRPVVDRSQPHRLDRLLTRSAKRVFFSNRCGRNWFLPLSRAGFRGPGGPGPQASHQLNPALPPPASGHMNAPRLNRSQTGRYSIDLLRKDGRLSCTRTSKQVGK